MFLFFFLQLVAPSNNPCNRSLAVLALTFASAGAANVPIIGIKRVGREGNTVSVTAAGRGTIGFEPQVKEVFFAAPVLRACVQYFCYFGLMLDFF